MLGIGSVIIWIGYDLQDSEFAQALDVKYIGYAVIGVGAGIILFAGFAFLGIWKDSMCLLGLFMLWSLIVGFALLALAGSFLYARDKWASDYLESESKCMSNNKLASANDAIIKADNIMCTYYCPCDLKIANTNLFSNQTETNGNATDIYTCDPCSDLSSYDSEVQNEIVSWINSNLNLKVTASNCKMPDDIFEDTYLGDYSDYLPFLKWMEKKFDCSGLCTTANLYLFSDINRGVPIGSCRQEIYDWIQDNFLTYGVIALAFGLFQILMFFLAAFSCCSRSRDKKKGA